MNKKSSSIMKLIFVIAIFLVGAYYAEANWGLKRCQVNADCEPTGCCFGIGEFLWCHDFTHEGNICTISSRYGCGCEPGLLCKRETGDIVERCVKNSTMTAY